jgi:hypothetical protein
MSFSFDKKKKERKRNEEEKQWSKKRKLTTVNYKQTNIDTIIIISQTNPKRNIRCFFFHIDVLI